jgi:hypothetical protein
LVDCIWVVLDSYSYDRFESGHLMDDEEMCEVEHYQQAKEACLFEFEENFDFEQSNVFYIIDFLNEGINRLLIYKDKSKEYHSIESLAGHKRLKLTDTALKQIGL